MIPAEIGIKTARVLWANEANNNTELSHTLDTVDEIRDKAAVRIASYQQQVSRHYNKNLRLRSFKINDWVLRKVFQNTKEAGAGKLAPTWEVPYLITKVSGNGAYKLQSRDGRDLANGWNATHLK